MKKCLSKIIPVLIIFWIFLYAPVGVITDLYADQHMNPVAKSETANVGYLENVLFDKLSGRERVRLVVSQQPSIAPTSIQGDNSLLISLENLYAPDNMREILTWKQALNVTDVQLQQRASEGKQWINLKINLKEMVPYSIRQEGKIVVIDFNISSVEAKLSANNQQKSGDVLAGDGTNKETGAKKQSGREGVNRYTDKIVSLDFQDADIKSVFRLMSEYGNVSIISGDDVKGNVTLTMRNVPWDQAFESILDIKGLGQKQTGNIISVMTLDRKKKDEADKLKAEEDKVKADDARKAREQQILVDKGKLRQILIEAKIVEVSEDFARNLGIKWGFGQHASTGNFGLGFSGGTNPLIGGTSPQAMNYPREINSLTAVTPLTMAAVNFPSTVTGPAFGLVFGGAKGFIETQLNALETTTQGKIISAPRVVTMDNVKAVIKQGDEVPYVTPASGSSAASVTFKEAVLRLEVKPKITDEGKISMEIKATNDTPDYATGQTLQGNPPIRKNEVESKVVVTDGDTVVIGGISRNTESKAVSGLPLFYKIPVLGWLFKTESVEKHKRQLMIFITPKILSESGYVEDPCDKTLADQLDRCPKRD